jgi:hypothetical protein
MPSGPEGTVTDDVEEAKVEVEYDEPTDERETQDTSRTATTSNANTTSSIIGVPEGASLVENTVTDDVNKDDDAGVKQIKMTVAADAPWKDRLWEGSLAVYCLFWIC